MHLQSKLFLITLIAIVTISCSSDPKWKQANIEGTITVADSLDNSGDYSAIEVMITYQESIDAKIDTIFKKETNKDGLIKGKVEFPDRGVYPVYISRNGNPVAASQFILAENDTIKFSGQLPDFNQNLEIDSREHRGMKMFNRIERGFNRIAAYINAGAVDDTLIYDEVYKWSDLYWEVAERNPGTIAEILASSESVRLLNIVNRPLMMSRIDQALKNERFVLSASNYGMKYKAESEGLNSAISYLDSLIGLTNDDELLINLKQKQIELYYDSAAVDEAKNKLEAFEKKYKDRKRAMEWAKVIGYDLAYLAPGYRVPDFSFVTQEGDSVSASSLFGKPFIIEITSVANRLYQSQYDRTVVIQQIYQNYDLEIYTIPLDQSEVTVNAFFEDRVQHWGVAKFGTFDIKKLIENFNVTDVPTRILVDQQGNIVRKYVASEFTDVIQGMNTIISQNKQGS